MWGIPGRFFSCWAGVSRSASLSEAAQGSNLLEAG